MTVILQKRRNPSDLETEERKYEVFSLKVSFILVFALSGLAGTESTGACNGKCYNLS